MDLTWFKSLQYNTKQSPKNNSLKNPRAKTSSVFSLLLYSIQISIYYSTIYLAVELFPQTTGSPLMYNQLPEKINQIN